MPRGMGRGYDRSFGRRYYGYPVPFGGFYNLLDLLLLIGILYTLVKIFFVAAPYALALALLLTIRSFLRSRWTFWSL
ncbi:hypothetical protein [Pyrococcus yayanosii]|uniref:Uncharacterized protein n=1 Tax=Pyrococcus yayanosii (strain CH1 / JCM 16557) TaxID=529709 RepID=F8AF30_PYRYC|nr:hypothetical protein [Pyrococcus yayanosii]AEH24874.1 hypothetical protein PYCH_11960 [Pyrococcus yayanosii CH1]